MLYMDEYIYTCKCGVSIYTPKLIFNLCPVCSWNMELKKIPISHDRNQDK